MTTTLTSSPRRASRQFHCLDLENLLGNPRFTDADVRALRPRYQRTAAMAPDAHVTLATSCSATLLTAGLAWTGTRRVWAPGPDGADHALLAVLQESIAQRFEHVVIGSGDGIFTDTAAHLAAQGAQVTVIARRGHLARSLRLAAHQVRFLDSTDLGATATTLRSAA